jgi:hypothetical protein
MTPELERRLQDTYPLLFCRRKHRVPLGVGDGWYQLIDTLCALIYWPYNRAQQDYNQLQEDKGDKAVAVSPDEVERARVRVQVEADAVPEAVQVKEKFGTLRFHVDGDSAAVGHYVEFAELHSSRVCEQCGCPGTLREDGWLRTLCDEHDAEYRARVGA